MSTALPHLAVIGLGGNLGDARQTLINAIDHMKAHTGTADWHVSSFYRTAPIGSDEAQPDYINGVAYCHTDLAPAALMQWLLDVERHFGRDRTQTTTRNAARTLDLDLLLYDAVTMDTAFLVLPHPRLHERAFVLQPLNELLPDLVIPGHGQVKDLLPQVSGQQITRLESDDCP